VKSQWGIAMSNANYRFNYLLMSLRENAELILNLKRTYAIEGKMRIAIN
jgi:hypothetical protein